MPLDTCPGWFSTMTWAVKSETPEAGLFLESGVTYPRLMSLTDTFLMLKPTLSPGTASGRDSWCISTDLTSVERPTGAKVTTMPGLSVGLLGGMMESRASRRVMPLALPSFLSTFQPLYQVMLVEASIMLSPCHPEMGTKATAAGL